MSELMTFTNKEFGKLRTILYNGVIYFAGEDISASLELNDVNKAIQMYVDEEDRMLLNFKTHSTTTPCLWNENDFLDKFVVNESGIYSLIFRSNVSKAREYKKWIAFEVFPDLHNKVNRDMPPANLSDIRTFSKPHYESEETSDNTFERAIVEIYSKNDLKDFELICEEEKQCGIGYFYLVEINNYVKIGCTQNPILRYNTLEREVVKYGGGTIGKIALSQSHGNYQENEKYLHNYFSKYRVDGTELFMGDLIFFVDNLPELECYERNRRNDNANKNIGCLLNFMSSASQKKKCNSV